MCVEVDLLAEQLTSRTAIAIAVAILNRLLPFNLTSSPSLGLIWEMELGGSDSVNQQLITSDPKISDRGNPVNTVSVRYRAIA